MTRREFVSTVAAAGAVACAGTSHSPAPARPRRRNLLILGGTGFLGPHLVDAARARGHGLTLFNRGKTHPGLFPDLEELHGDRDGHLEALVGRKFDAVLDTSGYVPRVVKQSAELLAPNVGAYLFVSTVSVYADTSVVGMDETAKVARLPDDQPNSEDVSKFYGALKALSEETVLGALPGRATVVRPGLLTGPLDPTDRFTYWPVRLDRGGEVLAPGSGDDPVQLIDARDLAAWCIHVVEEGVFGTFNALGPKETLTMRQMLAACPTEPSRPATLTWVPDAFLDARKVAPWSDMPVWVPQTPDDRGFARQRSDRAQAQGLRFRPIADTARDTLAWWKTLDEKRRGKLRAGLTAEREAAVLAEFHAAR